MLLQCMIAPPSTTRSASLRRRRSRRRVRGGRVRVGRGDAVTRLCILLMGLKNGWVVEMEHVIVRPITSFSTRDLFRRWPGKTSLRIVKCSTSTTTTTISTVTKGSVSSNYVRSIPLSCVKGVSSMEPARMKELREFEESVVCGDGEVKWKLIRTTHLLTPHTPKTVKTTMHDFLSMTRSPRTRP